MAKRSLTECPGGWAAGRWRARRGLVAMRKVIREIGQTKAEQKQCGRIVRRVYSAGWPKKPGR